MDHPTSPPLPDLGSFSYSWPTNKPLERADNDVDTYPARQCSFDFSTPPIDCSEQAAVIADADQMFRDGLLLPLRAVRHHGGNDDDDIGKAPKQDDIPVLLRSRSLDSSKGTATVNYASKRHRLARPASVNSSPSSLRRGATAHPVLRASIKLRLPSFRRCGCVLPRRLSCKYLRFLTPLYQKMVGGVGKRSTKKQASARAAADECSNGKVCEEAIRDAILHCKRSI
uniref:Membrane-associated kinase regulator 6 n=1 Tax=Leersia perrieri TaxID=77586 RepID=A0A0D9V5D5_9ORYZ